MKLARLCMLLTLVISASSSFPLNAQQSTASNRPNVLFIAIDDLNHRVSHLGVNPQTKTPNIDRLAASGVSFHKAYCAAPACNPSRIALMSGLRPSTIGCYDNAQPWEAAVSVDKLLNTMMRCSAGGQALFRIGS